MNRYLSRFILLLLIVVIAFFGAAPARAQLFETAAKQAIIVDYDTGAVLFEQNADERMPTSSMSKTMTIYLVFEALKKGRISLDDTFLVSEKAWRKGGSKMFVEVDKRVHVEDLIRGVIIQSGNDATIVLAEGLAGSEEAFAQGLNAKAQELGMTSSHFMNASGWPDPDHYSTARDLAILGIATIRDFPEYYPYYAEKEFSYNNIPQRNRNVLLYRDLGADGIKTGHTESGGYGLIGSGVYNGRRVVLVINGLPDEKARAQESARLLEWGLKRFENHKLFSKGETVGEAAVALGKAKSVPLALKDDLVVTIPQIALKDFTISIVYDGPLIAPVSAGQEVARLRVEIPHMQPVERPLYAAQGVERLGVFAGALAKVKILITGR